MTEEHHVRRLEDDNLEFRRLLREAAQALQFALNWADSAEDAALFNSTRKAILLALAERAA